MEDFYFSSDDESEQLNKIREKLDRRAKDIQSSESDDLEEESSQKESGDSSASTMEALAELGIGLPSFENVSHDNQYAIDSGSTNNTSPIRKDSCSTGLHGQKNVFLSTKSMTDQCESIFKDGTMPRQQHSEFDKSFKFTTITNLDLSGQHTGIENDSYVQRETKKSAFTDSGRHDYAKSNELLSCDVRNSVEVQEMKSSPNADTCKTSKVSTDPNVHQKKLMNHPLHNNHDSRHDVKTSQQNLTMNNFCLSSDESEQLNKIRKQLNHHGKVVQFSESDDFEDESSNKESSDSSMKTVDAMAELGMDLSTFEKPKFETKKQSGYELRSINDTSVVHERCGFSRKSNQNIISFPAESMVNHGHSINKDESEKIQYNPELDEISKTVSKSTMDRTKHFARIENDSIEPCLENKREEFTENNEPYSHHIKCGMESNDQGLSAKATISKSQDAATDSYTYDKQLSRLPLSDIYRDMQRTNSKMLGHRQRSAVEESVNEVFGFECKASEKENNSTSKYFLNNLQQSSAARASDGQVEHENCFELRPEHYAPAPLALQFEPIVHMFTKESRPRHTRPSIRVSQIYNAPINMLWDGCFEKFNSLQSEVTNSLTYSDDNVVVSAPTGAGKTVIFEMAMARFFQIDLQLMGQRIGQEARISKHTKIVYVSPSKALCEERLKDWSIRLGAMNIGVETVLVTGDGDPSESFRDLNSANLIITTPEKWDSLTRRWTENFTLFATVKLMLIDEVHLIADETRGGCLESIVARMKTIQRAATNSNINDEGIATSSYSNTTSEALKMPLRVVAVSATLPNISDIASFLEANEAYVFDESYRPVPLSTHVIAQGQIGNNSSSQFHFYRNLDRGVPEIIRRFCNSRPAIVFCHSKPETEKLADLLATSYNVGRRDNTNNVAGQTRVSKLQRVLMYGIAFHHAGLESDDRKMVQEAFKEGKVKVLCATSTLAMGVNLPAHLVIVKGTQAWRGARSGYQDLDSATLLQMLGRAGRPGYDSSGTAVILTDNDSKSKYEKLASNGLPPAQSQLSHKLIETINTEISQRVVTNIEGSVDWVKTTLFYVQLIKDNKSNHPSGMTSVDNYILQLCLKAIHFLRSIGAVTLSELGEISPCPASHVMSQHLVDHQAMEIIAKIPKDANQCQILKEISQIESLQFPLRRTEKKLLNELHKQLKAHKLDGQLSKVRIQEPWEKVFVLLQVYIEDLNLESSYNMKKEMTSIAEYASRMLIAIEEYSIHQTKYGNVIVQSLKLRRALALQQWNNTDSMLKQVKGISKSLAFTLQMGGISTFDDVLHTEEAEIERIAGRQPPFGAELRSASYQISKSRLQIHASIQPNLEERSCLSKLVCRVEQRPLIETHCAYPTLRASSQSQEVSYTLIAYDEEDGACILYRPNIVEPMIYESDLKPRFNKIFIHLVASMAKLDEKIELVRNKQTVPQNIQETLNERSRVPQERRIRSSSMQLTTRERIDSRTAVLNSTQNKDLRNLQARSMTTNSASNEKIDATTSVTPSPKPGVTSLTQKKDHAHESASPSLYYSDKRRNMEIPIRRNNDSTPMIHEQETCQDASSTDYARRDSESPQSDRNRGINWKEDGTNQVMARWVIQDNKRKAVPANNPFTSEPSPSTTNVNGTLWKRNKREQTMVQKRAFTHKKDNPFSFYKHDPNETETYLESLSNKNTSTTAKSSIIPEASLQELRNAYHETYQRSELQNSFSHRVNRMRQSRPLRLCNKELLTQKAIEQKLYNVPAIPTPMTQLHNPTNYSNLDNPLHQDRFYGGPSAVLYSQAPLIRDEYTNLNRYVQTGIPTSNFPDDCYPINPSLQYQHYNRSGQAVVHGIRGNITGQSNQLSIPCNMRTLSTPTAWRSDPATTRLYNHDPMPPPPANFQNLRYFANSDSTTEFHDNHRSSIFPSTYMVQHSDVDTINNTNELYAPYRQMSKDHDNFQLADDALYSQPNSFR